MVPQGGVRLAESRGWDLGLRALWGEGRLVHLGIRSPLV